MKQNYKKLTKKLRKKAKNLRLKWIKWIYQTEKSIIYTWIKQKDSWAIRDFCITTLGNATAIPVNSIEKLSRNSYAEYDP